MLCQPLPGRSCCKSSDTCFLARHPLFIQLLVHDLKITLGLRRKEGMSPPPHEKQSLLHDPYFCLFQFVGSYQQRSRCTVFTIITVILCHLLLQNRRLFQSSLYLVFGEVGFPVKSNSELSKAQVCWLVLNKMIASLGVLRWIGK